MIYARIVCVVALSLGVTFSTEAGDWTRFRGPNGSGISADVEPTPIRWSPTENLKWKTPLPGTGVSSPIVVGDRVFVTCYSGYGVDRGSGRIDDLKRHLICINRSSGHILWERSVNAVLPEDPYSGMGIPSHGYASHTPTSDGERVYVFFGKTGALAFDLNGKQLWHTSIGTESDRRRWGSASSPILYRDRLIVTASAESQALVALDTRTGEEIWRQEASGLDDVWGTPVVVQVDQTRSDIVLGVPYEIWGFNPESGKLRWYCEATNSDQFSNSLIARNGIVYAMPASRGAGGSAAVHVGGKGDITDSHVVWKGRDSDRYCTPIVHKDRLYYFARGIANCVSARTGERIYQSRISGSSTGGRRGGDDYSSPVIADEKLYYVRSNGDTHVIRPGDSFEMLAVNSVTNDAESFGASPAVSNGQLFLRSNRHLYCVADLSN